jgi:hypothetical protein
VIPQIVYFYVFDNDSGLFNDISHQLVREWTLKDLFVNGPLERHGFNRTYPNIKFSLTALLSQQDYRLHITGIGGNSCDGHFSKILIVFHENPLSLRKGVLTSMLRVRQPLRQVFAG